MSKIFRFLIGFWILFIGGNGEAMAQRINFSTWTGSEDVIIRSVGSVVSSLRFNEKQQVLLANTPAIVIAKNDPQVAIFEIEAPSEFDITVELQAPAFLAKDGDPSGGTIPFALQMSYSNQGLPNEIAAIGSALDVPVGFTSVTFPVHVGRRGVPLPPNPELSGASRPKSTVYLYIYGALGPIGQVSAGNYTGEVLINVYVAGGD
ncbi:MAG: hypothetical protein B7Z16_17990 [Algoriphagus sp. 32-45-6]|nr:MAG: hypothetical protein B7Z16_17990 [Algoriphagus sp. 32-45-6]